MGGWVGGSGFVPGLAVDLKGRFLLVLWLFAVAVCSFACSLSALLCSFAVCFALLCSFAVRFLLCFALYTKLYL